MSLYLRLVAAALLATTVAAPVHAAWHEAKSKHFIIYADENPKALLDYASRLEKFDQAARTILRMDDPAVGDGNRLTVFVLPTDEAVRKLAGDETGFLKGFYTGRATGSLAYVPKRSAGQPNGGLGSDSIFYHEYAHHLMAQQLDHPYPEWYVEGFAEFLSTPQFKKDGSVGLGAPPQHRAWGLFNGKSLPLETLLGGGYQISAISKDERESIYGRGWLLVHFLFMSGKRNGQLDRYLADIAKGAPSLDAARSGFGDLKALDKELDAYLKQRTVMTFNVAAAGAQSGPIDIKPLSQGAGQVVLLRAKMKKGVDTAEQEALAAEIRKVQTRFPGDELVELTLAEAELDTVHVAAAEAAADRALRTNPKSTEGMVLKGRAVLARAVEAEGDPSKLFAEARRLFISANKLDPEDPEPLMEFYKAFLRESGQPTANAIEALHYASNLAPQDLGLRMNSAVAYLNEGKLKEARRTLVPVAYSPHGGGMATEARRMIVRIDAGDAQGALRRPRPETERASDGS
jgi:cytochrome c-type biogenesis protein CcmH/NrfG